MVMVVDGVDGWEMIGDFRKSAWGMEQHSGMWGLEAAFSKVEAGIYREGKRKAWAGFAGRDMCAER